MHRFLGFSALQLKGDALFEIGHQRKSIDAGEMKGRTKLPASAGRPRRSAATLARNAAPIMTERLETADYNYSSVYAVIIHILPQPDIQKRRHASFSPRINRRRGARLAGRGLTLMSL